MLRRGFAPSAPETDAAKTAWEEAATEWQLEAERWVAQDKRAADMARKAYVSHVRAYATHVAAERKFFDVKELHLGHLAKAFALREKPGSIGRGGARRRPMRGMGAKGRVVVDGSSGGSSTMTIGMTGTTARDLGSRWAWRMRRSRCVGL